MSDDSRRPDAEQPSGSRWRMPMVLIAVILGIGLGIQFGRRLGAQSTCQDLAPLGARLEKDDCVIAGDLKLDEEVKGTQGGHYPRKTLPGRLIVKGNLTVSGDA